MADKERGEYGSYHSNFGSVGHLSQLNSKELVQSHIKSIMPSLKGGKKQNVHYLFVRVYEKLLHKVKKVNLEAMLRERFGDEYLNYETFKDKKQLLEENMKDEDLYYIFVPRDLVSWSEKFSKQEREESKGKKIVHVVEFMNEEDYESKKKQRKKLKKDPNSKIFYEINQETDFTEDVGEVLKDMEEKLAIRLRNEGDKVKNWALSNKFAQKEKKKTNLHFYIQSNLISELSKLQQKLKKTKYKWIQIHEYKDFSDIISNLSNREENMIEEMEMVSQVFSSKLIPTSKIIPTSKLSPEKSQLNSNLFKSQANIGSVLNTSNVIPTSKLKAKTLIEEKNFIVCDKENPEKKKFLHFIKSRENWKLLQIQYNEIAFIEKMIKEEEKKNNEEEELKLNERIIHARSLFILTFESDNETIADFTNMTNNFCNMELLVYKSTQHLKEMLYTYSKDLENFVIVVIDSHFYEYEAVVEDFIRKNKNFDMVDNLKVIDKKPKYTSQMSNLFMHSNFQSFDDSEDWLREMLKSRDDYFHPFNGLSGKNVYILVRFDKENELLDNSMKEHIYNTRRLKKTTYLDGNYLRHFLKTIMKKDSAIVLTDDTTLRQAQEVVKSFNECYIMNITKRKNVKDEIKVMAWGTREEIYDHIKNEIHELDREERKEYKEFEGEEPLQRKNRILPEIPWKDGNVITVRISSKEKSEGSAIMENRLEHYFNDKIRFQYYDKPNDIRLTNRKEEPLTFIICDQSNLKEIQEIAVQQVKDLRQEYIMHPKSVKDYKYLVEDEKYNRFRFVSSNWKYIEEYIIGIYESLKGYGNDSVYEDEYVHVFYHPDDQDLVSLYYENFSECPTYHQTLFHEIDKMEEIVMEESPHHIYYLIVNEKDGTMKEEDARRLIERMSKYNKKIKMLIIKKDRTIKKDSDVKAIHENGTETIQFISKTKLLKTKYEIIKPHVIFGPNNLNWYYFFEKKAPLKKYHHYYVNNNEELSFKINDIRDKQPGAPIWILVSDKKELAEYSKLTKKFQGGRDIYFIFHGQYNSQNPKKDQIIFADPNNKQIQALLLNPHKRSTAVFSPSALRNPPPIICISTNTSKKVPLNKYEMENWKEDLNADLKYFNNFPQVFDLARTNRSIYLVLDPEEERLYESNLNQFPNIKRIIYDTNQGNRTKAHKLTKLEENNKKLYFGYYPAQITKYLKYLRYNIKNPQEQLENKFDKELTQIYIEEDPFGLKDRQKEKILRENDSIARIQHFSGDQLELVIEDSLKYPEYNTLFAVNTQTGKRLERHKDRDKIHYIVYEERRYPQNKNAELLTNERPEYTMYLSNLPEKRYEKAKRLEKPLKLYYNRKLPIEENRKIKQISKRNKNFIPIEYQDINVVKGLKEPSVVLVDENDEGKVRNQLRFSEDVNYFILGSDKERNLEPDDRNTYFITKNREELPAFLNNTNVVKGDSLQPKRPVLNVPKFIRNNAYKEYSKPLSELNFNFGHYPPFKPLPEEEEAVHPIPRSVREKIRNDNSNILNIPSILVPDRPTNTEDIEKIREIFKSKIKPKPLNPQIDTPPTFNDGDFKTKPDNDNLVYPPPYIPREKPRDQKLAIIYPQTKQFKQIGQTLKNSLDPKYFHVDLRPFSSMHELEFYSKPNGQKIIASYDKIICFLEPSHVKYEDILNSIKKKFNNKLEYYIFEDDFDKYYPNMKNFLDHYQARQQTIPYINKEDPEFWLSSTLYNVLVPFNKKKKFDTMKRQNIVVTPYKTNEDIFNQCHRQNEFTIIVGEYKDYHRLKIFPRNSPRCILVIEDNYPVGEDEVVLFRFPKKLIYYGPDAYSYLSKFRIPTKSIPVKQENMKVLFYNENLIEEKLASLSEDFHSFEKVPYVNHEELFIYLIDRFKLSNNYKMKKITTRPTDLVRLHPKLFLEKSDYQEQYLREYSQIGAPSVFKKSFKSDIHPSLYSHLPHKYYKSYKDLGKELQAQDAPCIVITNASEQKLNKVIFENRNKHLFIQLIDLKDKWIEEDGDLTAFDKLARQELATKQILFTKMFSEEVFNTFNDMGYYYLSNRATIDEKRNIKFMTKEALEDLHKRQPNLLMILFVEHSDSEHIPKTFYDSVGNQPLDERVKLIFIKSSFIHDEEILYVKFNEIDPVIKHINKVQSSGRVDYCLYPTGEFGTLMWHKFIQDPTVKRCENKQFESLEQIDEIAKEIKGKFRKVFVICEPEDRNFIERKLDEYSIKTKSKSNEEVNFIPISLNEKRSFVNANSSIHKKSSMLRFTEQEEDNSEKFQTVGHAIDIKMNSSNKPSSIDIEEVIENKNFVLSVNEKLRNIFPIGNFYASKVKYFKSLKNLGKLEPGKSQIIISNENLHQIQEITEKNPDTFVIYVNNEMPTGQTGNTLIIKEEEIPTLIKKLEGSKEAEGGSSISDKLNLKNIEDYKTIKIVYDNEIDKQERTKILEVSIKSKNIIPCLFKDMKQIKEFMKEDDSLVVLMMSKDPPDLEEELAKENFMVVPKKRMKMLIPHHYDSAIDGLSTILEEQESEMDEKYTQSNLKLYLGMIEKNPQKNKQVLRVRDYYQNEEEEEKESYKEVQNDHENITKLNVHSNIRPENYLDEEEIYRIRQRLDGGVIVVVVEKKYTEEIKQILKKYNILIQEYSHAVNLDQSIRDRKDKVTIVVVEKNMLESIIPIKKQFPRLIFILLNEVSEEIPQKYKNFVSGEITNIPEIEKIIGEIYEENEKIKYVDQTKGPSRFDNRKVSTVDVGNSERFSVGFNNTRAKKAFVFYKDPDNMQIKNRLSDLLNNITFISYKNLTDIQKKLNNYGAYQSILIANNQDIYQIEDYVAKKKEQIYIIRFDPPRQITANPKVKLLFTAASEDDLYNYLFTQFQKNHLASERTLTSKLYNKKNIPEGKKYVQKYEPNTFGTTPRFPGDFVPPKSKESTYSRRYLKSTSRTSKILKTEGRSVDSRENPYYH